MGSCPPPSEDDWGPQKLIQRLRIELNGLPPHHPRLRRAILQKPGESSVPVTPVELAIKFIVHL